MSYLSMNSKVYGLIGLCQKAGKIVSGEHSCEIAIKKEQVCLLILATDASPNTRKLFKNRCSYRKIPLIEYGTKETLGNAIGKVKRASIGIVDENFANKIAFLIEQSKQ